MNRCLTGLVIVACIVLVAAGCQRAAQQPPNQEMAGETQTVNVVAREFSFDPKEIRVKAGMVKFVVKNDGSVEHDFEIVGVAEHGAAEHEQNLIKPGDADVVELVLQPATYEVVCTVAGHKEAGMTAVIVVE